MFSNLWEISVMICEAEGCTFRKKHVIMMPKTHPNHPVEEVWLNPPAPSPEEPRLFKGSKFTHSQSIFTFGMTGGFGDVFARVIWKNMLHEIWRDKKGDCICKTCILVIKTCLETVNWRDTKAGGTIIFLGRTLISWCSLKVSPCPLLVSLWSYKRPAGPMAENQW